MDTDKDEVLDLPKIYILDFQENASHDRPSQPGW